MQAFATIIRRLRVGAPADELGPFLTRLALPSYAVIGLVLGLGLIALEAQGFFISLRAFQTLALFGYFVGTAMLVRRIGYPRFATGMESLAVIYGQGLAGFFLLIPGAALAFPLQDGLLDRMDKALGLDWPAYTHALAPALRLLWPAYASFTLQPTVLIVVLASTGRLVACWRLATAGALALLMTALVFPFFPAVGEFAFHGIAPSAYPGMTASSTPFEFVPILLKIRSGYRILDASIAGGIVSFPSYHAASAAIFTWAAWRLKFLRWPFVALNIMLLLGAPILGSHYFVDLIAGLTIAVVSICLARRWVPNLESV